MLSLLMLAGAAHAETGSTIRKDCPPPAVSLEPPALYAVPTRLDRIGRVVAPVVINGRGPYHFVVDTGANVSAISPALAQDLGLEIMPATTMTLNGVTGSALVSTVRVTSLAAGDIVQKEQTLPVLEEIMGGADGVLGVEGFEDKAIRVDFVRDRITIRHSRGEAAGRDFVSTPARLNFGRLIVVDAKVGKVRVKAVIDTGAERTLGNLALRAALSARTRSPLASIETQVLGATPDRQRGDISGVPPIKIGNTTISDLDITFGDLYVFKLWELEKEPAILIGMDVLGVLDTLTIDYRRHELQIRLRSASSRMLLGPMRRATNCS